MQALVVEKTLLTEKPELRTRLKEVINEAYTIQACSGCGSLPESKQKGITGLGLREWTRSGCGVAHDRDVNAVKNILAVGHGRLAVGIPVL